MLDNRYVQTGNSTPTLAPATPTATPTSMRTAGRRLHPRGAEELTRRATQAIAMHSARAPASASWTAYEHYWVLSYELS